MISKTFYHFYDERITTIIQNIQKNVHPAGMLSNTVWSDLDSILYEIMHKAAVRTLIVEMHEKQATPEQIKNELDIQFGLHAYSISTVYRKVGLLKCGKNILEDEERPGRSIDEQLLYRIDQIIEDEPFASIRYIANILNSPESTVYRYVIMYLHKIYKHTPLPQNKFLL